MSYDPRLLSPTATFDPYFSPAPSDTIELEPWTPTASYFPETPSRTYRSSDKLVPDERVELYQVSSRRSSDGASSIQEKWGGWHQGGVFCVSIVALTLILNVIVTTWAATVFGVSGGIGTIHRGPCPSIKKAGLWLHIGINILSTSLLGASNYCMQCLCSPTKEEVDKAHERRRWLDIGIQSFRNLTMIRKGRMALWLILAASSIPLHLMFNSAIFVSLTANEYVVAAVSEDFVNGANWTLTGSDDLLTSIVYAMQQNTSIYERLEIDSCIREYGGDYLSARRHALVVVSGEYPDPLLGILEWTYSEPQNSWVCGTTLGNNMTLEPYSIDDYDCSIAVALGNDTSWVMADQPVEYCLSEAVDDLCRLQFAVPILIVVLCCNFTKLLCMVITLWKFREPTFVTLGDALSGMLEHPDPNTVGICIASKDDFKNGHWPTEEPRRWTLKRYFRFEAVGLRRFVFSNSVCAAACIALSVSLRFAIGNTTTSSDIGTLWRLGFGTVTSSSLIRWSTPIFGSSGLMKNVLLANSPQVILSLLYIIYNRLFTLLSLSKEWHALAHHRRPLRVTSPIGSQRSTYFLSLPYHYSIPILLTSVATHWILSQSLFLVAIDVFALDGSFDESASILSCGFSCIAMIFLIGIAWGIFGVGVLMGLRRLEEGMPLAGSCSAVISAACHPPRQEADAHLVPVQWGVTGIEGGVGHCAVSGHYVSPPITWRLYMGRVKEKEK